jgi:phospholipase C
MAKRPRGDRRVLTPSPTGAELLSDLSRRQFLAGVAAATGALALGGCGEGSLSGEGDPELAALPDPATCGIEHIVVVMMENRSFDHYLGWLPGADGMQAGREYLDKQGVPHGTFALAPDFQNCRFDDPDHSYPGGRLQYNDGANDGWLRARTDDEFPIGYYGQSDLAFFGEAVPAWTTCDRYFCSFLGPTYPNRFYLHAGQTDRPANLPILATMPTIWDRLADNGRTGTYYFSDLPVLALWGPRYSMITKRVEMFFEDAAAGRLADVTYIDPRFVGSGQGLSNDDHPLADIRNGQAFLNQIYTALTTGPNWPDTLLIVNYDEWGGFYDHVAPPLAPLTDLDPGINNDGRLGFRVPLLVASPRARRGFVGHQDYDHTSILRMIEWRWGLEPLSIRDETANNIANVLDFTRPKNLTAPQFDVPEGPFGERCSAELLAARSDFVQLRPMARAYGFDLPD